MPPDRFHTLHTFQKYFTVIAVAGITLLCYSVWGSSFSKPAQVSVAAADCTPTTLLVNPCRPWLGAAVGGYGMAAGDNNSQFLFFNKRLNNENVLTNPSLAVTINKKMDMPHVYHSQGTNLFSNSAKTVINNSTFPQIFVNWKPLPAGYKWKDAAGGNVTVDNYIHTAAKNVKAIAPRKIILAVWHEPENDVSSGNCASNAAGASMGSPADYVNMWANVRNIFNQEGVSNVVWAMNYMGYVKWDCLVPKLWPGNNRVDWIVFDQYASGTETFDASVRRFYTYLQTHGNEAANTYNSKPWGLAEHGYGNATGNSTEPNAINYWNQGKTAIETNAFSNIKMWLVFDTSNNGNSQVGYKFDKTTVQPAEQAAFNGFANAIFAKAGSGGGTTPPPADTTAPNVSITVPKSGATVSKVISVTASASDNVGVTEVKLYVDSSIIKDDKDGSDGWTSQWDTSKVGNGTHTLKAIAYDAAGNNRTATVSIAVNNAGSTPAPPSITSFGANPSTITAGGTTRLSWSTTNTTGCSVTPGGPTNTTATSWQTLSLDTVGTVTYTLTCKNSAGASTSASAKVMVQAPTVPPSNVALAASSTSIVSGGSVTLSWQSVGSTSCILNPGGFAANGTSSSKVVSNVKQTTTFKVTCSNSAGSTDSPSVTVKVTSGSTPAPAAPVITSFTAKPDKISSGGTSTLSWVTTNVMNDGCRLEPGPLTSVSANNQWTTPPLVASSSYTLTCQNSAGVKVSRSLSVIVDNQSAPAAPPPAESVKPGADTSASVIKTAGGKEVVNAEVANTVRQGELLTLEPSQLTDGDKAKSITKIEFYSGQNLIQTVTDEPFALDTNLLQPGTYNLTQRTYYADGSMSQKSQIVTITAKQTGVLHRGINIWVMISGVVVLAAAIAGVIAVRVLIRRHMMQRYVAETAKPFDSDVVDLPSATAQPSQVIQPGDWGRKDQ